MRAILVLFAVVFSAGCLDGSDDNAPVAVSPSPLHSAGESDSHVGGPVPVATGSTRTTAARATAPNLSPSVSAPTAEDLAKFTKGIDGRGTLRAEIVTNAGQIDCDLFEDEAPIAVASFVGLARGLQPWVDPVSKRVVHDRPFYDGLTFHRVIAHFVIQGGDPKGDGTGGPGYRYPNEVSQDLKFDRAGRLATANKGPGTNGSQFFVTLAPEPQLNGGYTIFGQCKLPTVQTIASVAVETPKRGVGSGERSRPKSPVVIRKIRFDRH